MTDRLIVVGAGGHGREALAVARSTNRLLDLWGRIELVDDGQVDLDRLERIDATFLGSIDDLIEAGDPHIIAIGDPAIRRRVADRIGDAAPAVVLTAPSSWIGDDVVLDDGALVFPGAVCTTNVRVGRHAHINCGVIVSHDCRIGEFVSVSPGVRLNGDVTIDDGAFLGTGAIVLPGRRVGQNAVVGAGAVVTEDVAPGATVIGVPAR